MPKTGSTEKPLLRRADVAGAIIYPKLMSSFAISDVPSNATARSQTPLHWKRKASGRNKPRSTRDWPPPVLPEDEDLKSLDANIRTKLSIEILYKGD